VTEIGSMCRLKSKITKNVNFADLQPVYELSNHQEYLSAKEYEILNQFICIQHLQIFPNVAVWAVFSSRTNEFTFILTGKLKNVD
jgi:hypothetical protein